MKKDLIIINNEKCIKKGNNFYCENLEIKSITELLSKTFNVKLILRRSVVRPVHKINNSEIVTSSNIFSFIKNIVYTVIKDKGNYLIISVTPYTLLSFFVPFIIQKKNVPLFKK